jgi:hypothetical protein
MHTLATRQPFDNQVQLVDDLVGTLTTDKERT